MLASLNFLSTMSGKSIILALAGRKYAFNMFEGFQRYCIEASVRMGTIDVVFFPDRRCVPALAGAYLSLGDMPKEGMKVVAAEPVDMAMVHRFAKQQTLCIEQMQSYADENIDVRSFRADGVDNYLVKFAPSRGKLHVERVPPAIPKKMYKQLLQNETLEVDGVVYYRRDYADEPVQPDTTAIIFSDKCLKELPAEFWAAPQIICTTRKSLSYARGVAKDSTVYFVRDSPGVDYLDLYEKQLKMNAVNSNHLLPCWPLKTAQPDPSGCVLLDRASELRFNNQTGFVLHRTEELPKTEFVTVHNEAVTPSIVFLGTGCSSPSNHRNVSSILYESRDSAMLLDCGEDTTAQIRRLYGDLGVLAKLKLVYLSHSHADHILGTTNLLQELRRPITVVAPRGCRSFIEKYGCSPSGEFIHRYIETTDCKALEQQFYDDNNGWASRTWTGRPEEEVRKLIAGTDMEKYAIEIEVDEFALRIVGAQHCHDSGSVVVHDSKEGTRFAYSGDTSPSVLFAALAQNVDVLVHEATFIKGQEENAEKTNHSLVKEAEKVAYYANAKKLLLTHYSNRNTYFFADDLFVEDFYRHVFRVEPDAQE
ncbi:ribonuclease Z [Pancytospora philotis]|nr:ribonuclease Z [Pancytospora philotis]